MDKYYAELKFGPRRQAVRFTTARLELLMKRFTKEVEDEQTRRSAARDYTSIVPNLTVEICRSWSEFDQYEHS